MRQNFPANGIVALFLLLCTFGTAGQPVANWNKAGVTPDEELRDAVECGGSPLQSGGVSIFAHQRSNFDACISAKGYTSDSSGSSMPQTSQDADRQSVEGTARGGNIADAFYRDAADAIRFYSTERSIILKVQSVSTERGKVFLTETQVPTRFMSSSAPPVRNWSDFHRQAVQGENAYAQMHRIVCAINMSDFSQMQNVRTGSTVTVRGKLSSVNDKVVVFDCR